MQNSEQRLPFGTTAWGDVPGGSGGRKRLAGRSLVIDLLRIFSASLIFYFHVGKTANLPGYFLAQFATGVFMVAAGYCSLRYSRSGQLMRSPSWEAAVRFVQSRFLAVYPTYAIIAVAIFAGSFLYPATARSGAFSAGELAVNLLAVNRLFGVPFFSDPMWFFPFLMQVYVLIPAMCLLGRRPRWMILVSFVISTAACLWVYAAAPEGAAEICRSWSPIFRLPIVAVGVALALRGGFGESALTLGVFVACALLREWAAAWLPEFRYTLGLPLRNFLMFSAMALAAFAGAGIIRFLRLPTAPVAKLAQAALPFFLIHGVFIHAIDTFTTGTPLIWAAYFVFCWMVSLAYLEVYSSVRKWMQNRGSVEVPEAVGE